MTLSLFDVFAAEEEAKGDLTLRERFERYHLSNPDVYRLLVKFAREVKRKGNLPQYGIAALFERVRWHYAVERGAGEEFKLNNSYRAFYARLIMRQEKDLQGFFEVREQRTKEAA